MVHKEILEKRVLSGMEPLEYAENITHIRARDKAFLATLTEFYEVDSILFRDKRR